jgi:hypothetical protein
MAHGDYTGKTKARLAQQYADQVALAAQSQTLVTQVVTEGQNTEINLFTDRDYENLHTKRNVDPNSGEAEVVEVDVEDPQFKAVKFRASETLDQVTVGQGREFNLEQGRVYVAPRWVVEHLDVQGLVWH